MAAQQSSNTEKVTLALAVAGAFYFLWKNGLVQDTVAEADYLANPQDFDTSDAAPAAGS